MLEYIIAALILYWNIIIKPHPGRFEIKHDSQVDSWIEKKTSKITLFLLKKSW